MRLRHTNPFNDGVYYSSDKEEIDWKNCEIHHSKSSDIVNNFGLSLLKFNQKEIVVYAIELAQELYPGYFQKNTFCSRQWCFKFVINP